MICVKIEELRPLMEERFAQGMSFTFKPGGVSMLPFIRGGRDAVTVEKYEGHIKKYDIVFFRRKDGRYIMHRVIKIEDESIKVCGDNQYWKETITEDMIFAVVTKTCRKMKGAVYFFYCRTLWLRRFYCHVRQWIRFHIIKKGGKR